MLGWGRRWYQVLEWECVVAVVGKHQSVSAYRCCVHIFLSMRRTFLWQNVCITCCGPTASIGKLVGQQISTLLICIHVQVEFTFVFQFLNSWSIKSHKWLCPLMNPCWKKNIEGLICDVVAIEINVCILLYRVVFFGSCSSLRGLYRLWTCKTPWPSRVFPLLRSVIFQKVNI